MPKRKIEEFECGDPRLILFKLGTNGNVEEDSNSKGSSSLELPTTSTSGENSENDDQPPKKKQKKRVCFNDVTVFYFPRSQGFTCVPSEGGSTLGMKHAHEFEENFTLQEHAETKKKHHRDQLVSQRKNNKALNTDSEEDESEDGTDISDSELENDSNFLQPIPVPERRQLLRESGIKKIESNEKEECRQIRASRDICGCECKQDCDPETCSCSQAGIKCQVDRTSFPCGCSREGCSNLSGRIEFNPIRVRTHFIHTLMRLEFEKKQDQIVSSASALNNSRMNPYSYGSNCNPTTSINAIVPRYTLTTNAGACMLSNLFGNRVGMPTESDMDSSERDETSEYYSSPFSLENSSYSENSDYSSDENDSGNDNISKNIPILPFRSQSSKNAINFLNGQNNVNGNGLLLPSFNSQGIFSPSANPASQTNHLNALVNHSEAVDRTNNQSLTNSKAHFQQCFLPNKSSYECPAPPQLPPPPEYIDLSSATTPNGKLESILSSSVHEVAAIRPVHVELVKSNPELGEPSTSTAKPIEINNLESASSIEEGLGDNFGEIIKNSMVETVSA